MADGCVLLRVQLFVLAGQLCHVQSRGPFFFFVLIQFFFHGGVLTRDVHAVVVQVVKLLFHFFFEFSMFLFLVSLLLLALFPLVLALVGFFSALFCLPQQHVVLVLFANTFVFPFVFHPLHRLPVLGLLKLPLLPMLLLGVLAFPLDLFQLLNRERQSMIGRRE